MRPSLEIPVRRAFVHLFCIRISYKREKALNPDTYASVNVRYGIGRNEFFQDHSVSKRPESTGQDRVVRYRGRSQCLVEDTKA
jgi:hypothetical protein